MTRTRSLPVASTVRSRSWSSTENPSTLSGRRVCPWQRVSLSTHRTPGIRRRCLTCRKNDCEVRVNPWENTTVTGASSGPMS